MLFARFAERHRDQCRGGARGPAMAADETGTGSSRGEDCGASCRVARLLRSTGGETTGFENRVHRSPAMTTTRRIRTAAGLFLVVAAIGTSAVAQQTEAVPEAGGEPATGAEATPAGTAAYVECWKLKNWVDAKGFCAAAVAEDTDGDGVSDALDRCAGTAPGTVVDANGCPPDGDGDGVADARDRCPGTPKGAPVDPAGCQKDHTLVIGNIEFGFDSDRIEPGFAARLDSQISYLAANPKVLSIVIEGYTDSTGPEAYNQDLSYRRALAVRDYLIGRGVEADRVRAVGRGEANPVASNATEAGRAANRRVELIVDTR